MYPADPFQRCSDRFVEPLVSVRINLPARTRKLTFCRSKKLAGHLVLLLQALLPLHLHRLL